MIAKTAAQEKLLGIKVLVVPVFHEQSGPGSEHWTTLVLEQEAGSVTAVRYYDSLQKESQGCREHAQKIMHHLTNNDTMELPKKKNKRYQTYRVDWHQRLSPHGGGGQSRSRRRIRSSLA